MFSFFFLLSRTELITFCGSNVEDRNPIEFDPDGDEGKFCFRKIENGQYQPGEKIITRHPHILKSVMSGKRGWGLWRDQWTDGIAEHTFTKEEIMQEFIEKKVIVPESFLKEFDDFLEKKKRVRLEREIERLNSGGMWK